MKKVAIIALMTLCLPAMAQTDKQEPAVVILTAGQSNTDGRVGNEELPDYIQRDGYKYCQWSFGSGVHSGNGRFEPFAPRIYNENKPRRWAYDAVVYYMLEKQLQRPFYVIKESLGGTAIDTLCRSNSNMHWSADPTYLQRTAASDKGGLSLLKAFTENIGSCIDNKLSKLPEGYDIKAMLWHQGESDRSQADRYYDNLKAVVAYLRTYLVNKTGQQKYAHLPFICGTFSTQSRQGSLKVVEALRRLEQEDPDFHVVDVSDATLQKDQIHFDASGAELLGMRVYSKLQAAVLKNSGWENSEWLSVKDAQVVTGKASVINRAADGASWFVTTVENEKEVVSAKWTTTALGVYELYLNGQPVGEEILKPGFTHYAKTRRSFTHDVTALLKKEKGARNQLAAQVTPGWWADKIITPNNYNGMLGEKCAFRCVLELTFADGSRQCFGTNRKDWLAGIAGPVKHAAIFDGEEYDARIQPGYADVNQLKEPELNTAFKGEILPSEGAEVYLRKDLTLQPVKAHVWQGVTGAKKAEQKEQTEHGTIVIKRNYAKGETISLNPGETLVVDFGQNSAAVPSFVFKAKAGTKLTCLPSEILNDSNGAESRGMDGPEGSVHRRNLRMHEDGIRIDYTFADSKNFVSYRPRCTFFGYRYISVTATDKVQIKKVESIPVSSITKEMETGSITTGNELINQLISNTLWGQRSNYLSVPTDCPQRNERLGWTADTQVFAETGTFFANTNRFFHKWMRDMRDTQSPQGGFPGVAPAAQYGSGAREMMRIGWADAGVIVPWTVWKQFGDKSIINENWEAMEHFMLHVDSTRYDHQALAAENGNYQWADWLSYEPLESCGRGAFDKNGPLPDAITYWNYLGASYWAIDAAMMADMASATGRDATRYQQMAKTAREYLKKTFLDDNGKFKTPIFNTMQTPALFALRNGLVEGDAKQQLIQRLRKNFADHDNCLQTGFLGTSILMLTLTDNGMADIAYELLFQRKNPSWLYSIDNGATTIWERWNSYMIEHGMGPKGMNSFNHYAYGCVCQWLWENVAGIAADTANPGFKHIVMKPLPDKRLGFVKAEYLSAAGLIKSYWHYEGDLWIWDVTIPANTTATLWLPNGKTKNIGSGEYHFKVTYK